VRFTARPGATHGVCQTAGFGTVELVAARPVGTVRPRRATSANIDATKSRRAPKRASKRTSYPVQGRGIVIGTSHRRPRRPRGTDRFLFSPVSGGEVAVGLLTGTLANTNRSPRHDQRSAAHGDDGTVTITSSSGRRAGGSVVPVAIHPRRRAEPGARFCSLRSSWGRPPSSGSHRAWRCVARSSITPGKPLNKHPRRDHGAASLEVLVDARRPAQHAGAFVRAAIHGGDQP